MANYELTIIAVPPNCQVTADGRAPHYRSPQTGVNGWHTRRGVHEVVLRLNGVELHVEVDNSDGGELTVHMGASDKFDSTANPTAQINSKDLMYRVAEKNSRGKEVKESITRKNMLAARGLKKGTYYVRYRVRPLKSKAPDPNAAPRKKFTAIG